MLPSVRAIYPEEEMPIIRYVQDNSAIHTAAVIRTWFDRHPEIQKLEWPSRSPDLNPIENIWAIMMRSWQPERGMTEAQLHDRVIASWESLRRRPQVCSNAVGSMNERLHEVITNNGHWTRH